MNDQRVTKLIDEATKLRYSRRGLLKRASALGLSAPAIGAALAATGHAASAAPNRAPAFLQGTSLTILEATYFVPAGQDLFNEQAQQWGAENNVDVTVDFVNWPDLQPRISSAVQAGAGADVIEMWDTWPYLYYPSMVDVNDLAGQIGEAQGGFFEWADLTATVDGDFYSIPHGTSTSAFTYRISYFEEAGVEDPVNNFPDTWEELMEVGVALKEMGKPLGQAFGHSTGDPPSWAYSYMWAYGAMEVDEEGNVAFNQDMFVEGMEKLVEYWPLAFDETGLAWDDATNNRAYLADEISGTFNGSSIYLAALEEAPEIAEDTHHHVYFEGPAGRFNLMGSRSMAAMNYSDNVEGALDFLEWWFQPEQYQAWLESQEGYHIPPAPQFSELPIYTEDPKLEAYLDVADHGRNKGYAGPANEAAARSFAEYVVVDAFAEAIQSGNAAEAIENAHQQLERIFR